MAGKVEPRVLNLDDPANMYETNMHPLEDAEPAQAVKPQVESQGAGSVLGVILDVILFLPRLALNILFSVFG